MKRIRTYLRALGRAIMQLVYLVLFALIIAIALIALLLVVLIGPAAFIAWALARVLYWLLCSLVIALNPSNWGRLHRWPPLLNLMLCALIFGGVAWVLWTFKQIIVSGYATFVLNVVWPFVGWLAPSVASWTGWFGCPAVADEDKDPCKEALLAMIQSSDGEMMIAYAIVAIWAIAICALIARATGEARRICLVERAP
jgi:hypothetical protein